MKELPQLKTIKLFQRKVNQQKFSADILKIGENLGIDGLTNISSDNDAVSIRKAIEKYQNHPSVKTIQENVDTTNNFSFDLINSECISKIINNLDSFKFPGHGLD